jgi:anion-transporting  ArsA/GET3 family ATPase
MVLPEEVCLTPYARARRQMQQGYLAEIERRFAAPVLEVPLLADEVTGIERVNDLVERLFVAPSRLQSLGRR